MSDLAVTGRLSGEIFAAFANEVLCSALSTEDALELFREMCYNTREFLDLHFDPDGFFLK